jgi:hypothetical protein
VEEWVRVCANAYRLWRDADPPKAPLQNLLSRAVSAQTCTWFGDATAQSCVLDESAPSGGNLVEHRIGTAETAAVYGVMLPIASGGNYAFSTWVRIPEGFRGRDISAVLGGYASIAQWTADPKSSGRWQRIWVSANLPLEAGVISCLITSQGATGDVFHSASWCLERGNRPLGNGFTLLSDLTAPSPPRPSVIQT